MRPGRQIASSPPRTRRESLWKTTRALDRSNHIRVAPNDPWDREAHREPRSNVPWDREARR